ncbi:hypothetical protein [Streptomyces fagopyri]|uniref:aromatic-ring hydroxylase C-terminal domain-containing protein n=1 Tax=Streptomyces fagopyri TaxID=2662397 RepID=UPI0033E3A747
MGACSPTCRHGRAIDVNVAGAPGWQSAAQVRGWASETLLDSYHAERRRGSPCVLLRPGGHVSWIGDDQRDLDDHVAHWLDKPTN